MTTSFATLPASEKSKFSERHDLDFYPTMLQDCRQALQLIPVPATEAPLILDPGAGDGPWGLAARSIWPGCHIAGVEVRPEAIRQECYAEWFRGGFCAVPRLPMPVRSKCKDEPTYQKALKKFETREWIRAQTIYCGEPERFDLVIGNPPYEFAEQFTRAAFRYLRPGGICLFLLRLAFLEGQDRAESFYRDCCLRQLHVYAKRPSFFPAGHPKAGKTDATAYAVFMFQRGWIGRWTGDWILPASSKTRQPSLFEATA